MQQEHDKAKAEKRLTEKVEAVQDCMKGFEELRRGLEKSKGDIYVHDPVLDEGSDEATAFVNELLKRPF